MSGSALRKVPTAGLFLAAMILLPPGLATAQDKLVEISGGWSYAHEKDVSIPGGWYVSGGRYLNGWFGLVGEANGHYKTITESGIDVKTRIHVFAAGPRFAYRGYPRVTPFVDLLVGGSRATATVGAFNTSVDQSMTNFAYQSQFGVIFNSNSGTLGLRLSGGDFGIRSDGEWTNDSLVEIGVVIRP